MRASEIESLIGITDVLTKNSFRFFLALILHCNEEGFTTDSVSAVGRMVGQNQQAASRSFNNLAEIGAVSRNSGVITIKYGDFRELYNNIYKNKNKSKNIRGQNHAQIVCLWNDLGLRPWRKSLTQRQISLIDAYGVDTIEGAIKTYAEVLYGDDYYYSAKISFDTFLEKKVRLFMKPKEIFLKWDARKRVETESKWLEAIKAYGN